MDVKEITVHLRYSANVKGAWKTVELIATASEGLGSMVPLYEELAARLKLLFSSDAAPPPPPPAPPPPPPAPPLEDAIFSAPPPPVRTEQEIDAGGHWCREHGVAYTAKSHEGRTWYSHKHGDAWCNEKKARA